MSNDKWRVERHDCDDGSINYEIWQNEPVSRIATLNDSVDDANARENAEMICKHVNASFQESAKADNQQGDEPPFEVLVRVYYSIEANFRKFEKMLQDYMDRHPPTAPDKRCIEICLPAREKARIRLSDMGYHNALEVVDACLNTYFMNIPDMPDKERVIERMATAIRYEDI